MLKITNGRDLFYQWDIGQSLTLTLAEGETVTSVHIGNDDKNPDGFYVVEPISGIVAVYDELLQSGQRVVAYEYVKSGNDGHTVRKYVFNVAKRPKADNYEYTPTTSYSWEYWCERARLYAVAAEGSKNSAAASVSSIPATMTAWWNAHRSEFKGDAGANGQDGYSPTATVSKVGTTSTITITDKNGTTTASVVDGETPDLTDYVKNTDLANEQRRIDYLYMVNEGITYNWETDDDEAYVKNVPSGAVQMGVNKIGGKSVVVNQLLPFDSDFSYTNPNIGIEFKNSNGRITTNGTALVTATPSILPSTIYRQIKPKVGHKHFIKFSGNHNLDMLKFYVFYSGGGVLSVDANTIFTTTSEASEGEWVAKFTKDQSYTCDFTSCLIDLTQMFGAGNEPSLAECQQIFSNDYYPYNTGELISASSKKIVSKSVDGTTLTELTTDYGVLRSAGSVYDYVDLDRGVLVRRVGTVDLGSLSYGKYDITQGTMFRTTIASMVDVYDNLNLVCAKYTTTKDSARVNGGISQTTNSQIDIVDSSYTDTTSFKSAMNGVKLYYELATPTEEPITVKGNTLDIESGGTITFVSDVTDYHIPVPSEETYMVKVSEV